MGLTVGVVHTRGSPCRCGVSISGALAERGHEAVPLDVDEVAARPSALVRLDCAFEHADTWQGLDLERNMARLVLEAAGVPVVGGSATACLLADHKVFARQALTAAGVLVPEGVVVERPEDLPAVPMPCVVKRAVAHGSRGVVLVADLAGLEAAVREAFAAGGGPLVVERLVPGREVAVTVVGAECLPPVEVSLPNPGAIYDRAAKWQAADRGPRRRTGTLSACGQEAVVLAALAAFRALGLAGYGRVDMRLDADGRPWVLEVNARPSLEPGFETAVAAEAAGIGLAGLIDLLAREAAATRA